MAKTDQHAALEKARTVLKRIQSDWMARPGVTAVDVGFKIRGGKLTEEIAIRIFVRKKRPPSALASEEMIPGAISGVRTDVIEAEFSLQSCG